MATRKIMMAALATMTLGSVACGGGDGVETGDEQYAKEVRIEAEPQDGGEVEIFRSNSNDRFYFRMKAANGQIILQSEAYESIDGAANGARSAKENAQDTRGFELKPSSRNPRGLSSGEWFFNVKGNNGEVVGTSEMYASKDGAKKGAQAVMGYSKGRTMLDYWTDQCGFELYNGADGDIWFRLRADNGEKLLRSEGYASESGAKRGIDTVVTLSLEAEYDNGYLPAYEIEQSTDDEYYWNLVAANGEVVGTSGETFETQQSAEHSIEVVQEHAREMIACWTIDEPREL